MQQKLRTLFIIGFIVFTLFIIPKHSFATTYYVDGSSLGGTCNNSNSGTSLASPWCTIQKAASTAVSGDTVYIRGGTYRETATLSNSGTSGSPITFMKYQSETPIINGADLPSTWISLGNQESGGSFNSGFETGDLSEYTSTTTESGNAITVQSSTLNHGLYAMQGSYGGTNRNARANINFTAANDGYARLYFRLNSTYDLTANDSGQVILNLRQGSTTNLAQVLLLRNSSGQFYVQARTNSPSTNTFYSGTAGEIVRDTWYSIELRFKGADASTGGAEFWLNNTSKGSIYSLNTSTYQSSRLELGGSTSGPGIPTNGSILYMDDVKVDTAHIGNFSPAANPSIYKTTNINWTARAVFEDGTRLTSAATLGDVDAAGEWYLDTGSNILYVWSTNSASPATHTTEVARRNSGIDLSSRDYITINGLTLKYHNNTSFGSIQLSGSDGVTITQSTISDNHGSAIFANNSTNNTFSENQLLRNLRLNGAGIRLENGSNTNTIYHNTITGLGLSGGNGIFFCGDSTCSSIGNNSNTISLNTISNVYDSCVYLDSNNDSNTIERNTCFDSLREDGTSGGNGIHVALGSDSNVIKNNLVYNTQRHGISIRDNTTGNQILNNTIYNTGFGSGSFGESGNGINIQGTNTATIVKNNIAHTAKTAPIGIETDSASTISDYNIFYNASGFVAKHSGNNYSTFSSYQTATGQDSHSKSQDPLFNNIGGNDFSLSANSGAIDAGLTLATVTNDIAGTGRPQGCYYDIGAYEHSGSCVSITPTTSAANSSSNGSTKMYPPACNDTAPGTVDLYGAIAQNEHSILLYFTEAHESYDRYAIEYGTESGKYIYGAQNIGKKGARTFLVEALKPNTTYYFRIRADHGCATGPWSNEKSAKTSVNEGSNSHADENLDTPSLSPPPAPRQPTIDEKSTVSDNKKDTKKPGMTNTPEDQNTSITPTISPVENKGIARNFVYIFPILFVISLFVYMKLKN